MIEMPEATTIAHQMNETLSGKTITFFNTVADAIKLGGRYDEFDHFGNKGATSV